VARLATLGVDVCPHDLHLGDIARSSFGSARFCHVFHLAARTYVPESWLAPVDFYRTNVAGTANILELCRRVGASATVISSYVYGRPKSLPIAESHPLEALNPYSHSKILAEEVCRYYSRTFDVKVCIVRPFNIYGPGQREEFLVPTLVKQALDPRCEAIMVSDVRPRRDYIYIDDLVDLLLATFQHRVSDVFNAGSGKSTSIPELVGTICELLGRRKPLVSCQHERREEVYEVVADISKAITSLGWRPAVSLNVGLRRTIEWMSARHENH